jgi:Spy/CpxP family protein refolding chaperone
MGAVLIVALLAGSAYAQDTAGTMQSDYERGMMAGRTMGQGGMLGGMMGQGGAMCGMMGDMMDGMRGGLMMGRDGYQFYLNLREELNLTPDQVSKLQAIRLDFAEQALETWSDLILNRIRIQDALQQDEPSMNDVEKAIRNAYGLEADLQVQTIRAWNDARDVLTPEQREQARTSTQRGRMMHHETGGMGGEMSH